MSDYDLVSTLHAIHVALADARKIAATIPATEAKLAAARAAVDAALADGRVVSDKHLLDLDLDCLGAILSHLGPRDAFSVSRTCTTLRSALFRGGLPGPLALVCQKFPFRSDAAAAALRALDGMEPALGARRLFFLFESFDEGHARVLARALDAAPRAARFYIALYGIDDVQQVGRLADILSSPERAISAATQVDLRWYEAESATGCRSCLMRLIRAGVCVTTIQGRIENPNFIVPIAANTLTELSLNGVDTVDLTTRFPALRRLSLDIAHGENFTSNVPSLTALAPHLKDIHIRQIHYGEGQPNSEPPAHGFSFDPGLFARFVAAIQGVTRVHFGLEPETRISETENDLDVMLLKNVNENLGQLTALQTLRELVISCGRTFIALESGDQPCRAPVADDAITNLPPLAPGLTRLAFSRATRVAFGHPLPELRVLDCRGLSNHVNCATVWTDDWDRGDGDDDRCDLVERDLHVPLSIPSAMIAPNLHTLLIGYQSWNPRGDFDLWTLVAARTALRVVVIEHARLLCSAPGGFETTTGGFAALLAREAMLSIHTHGCEIEGGHEPSVENFLRALEQRGGRVCRAGAHECMFCMLHDGADLWPRE